MSVVREMAAIGTLSLPRWRRDIVLAAAAAVVMAGALWIPFGR